MSALFFTELKQNPTFNTDGELRMVITHENQVLGPKENRRILSIRLDTDNHA